MTSFPIELVICGVLGYSCIPIGLRIILKPQSYVYPNIIFGIQSLVVFILGFILHDDHPHIPTFLTIFTAIGIISINGLIYFAVSYLILPIENLSKEQKEILKK